MAPSKWDDEEEESSSEGSPAAPIARRGKFDDEEEDDDVLESWDAAEDSEVEREKAKKAEEAKAKAAAEAKANHKSKAQRIEERRQENMRRRQLEDDISDEDEEDEATRRARLRKNEQDADLAHAEDMFGSIGINPNRGSSKPVTISDANDPTKSVDLSALPIFNPQTKDQFTKLREVLVPLISNNAKKAQYSLFLQEFTKQISKELPSDQIKKIASGLTTLSNEKMKEEKAAEKGGKKTKAAKTKVSLNASRDVSHKADTAAYDDDFGDDDFM
ncbi:translation initiation factor eIF3 subunit [Aaosphaeria arxii CBS 175.79]|uniref:Eukaryotic translation initiation factor 3 subunit J n=1 Tax=Aaosphaeria arxii CBS 175.79 TaxID=1450172 RepID=A0A6A5XL82_9PLEO|nr:translation initiation factor eIF3 subunit [Aaosphaeria arxii CBS 175.79]KAF2013646.1 translation initiation factor eIF3 subunit [Aaosphaeria arxii CBS 175.79]